jgi:hypothetical protein
VKGLAARLKARPFKTVPIYAANLRDTTLVSCPGNTRNMPDDAAEMKVIEKAGPSTPLRFGRDDKLIL